MTIPPAFFILLAVLAYIGFKVWEIRQQIAHPQVAPAPDSPRVVVNMPADYTPMASLPPTEIEGAKAVLWWTVYEKCLDAAYQDSDDAISAADAAVDKVFHSR